MVAQFFDQLKPFKALVVGDFLLDVYTSGKVKRISPEAPVPILEVAKEEERAGGAGNVLLNLIALGAEVHALGRVGDDDAGKRLGMSLLVEEGYQTPVKNRLIANGQQLLRIDHEVIAETKIEEKAINELKRLIPKVQIVALSDYGKGFLTKRIIRETMEIAKKHNVPVVVDPKGIDFAKYKGARIIKPNLSEAFAAAGTLDLNEAAKRLLAFAETLLITRSEAGIAVFEQNGERFDFSARFREVKDVTGAGDTVLATLCMGLSCGLDVNASAELANIAAGIAVERVGCAQITLDDLAERVFNCEQLK